MYNKLFSKVVRSSIWLEPLPTRVVWIAFLATMDEDGFVQCSAIGNVAALSNVSIEDAQAAIKTLENPDPESGNSDHEGRRIERCPGGWIVLNAKAYRELATRDMEKARNRQRVQRHREEKKRTAAETDGNTGVQDGNAIVRECNEIVAPSEAEAEAEAEGEGRKGASLLPAKPADKPAVDAGPVFRCVGKGPDQWQATSADLADWEAAYPHLDVPGEFRKAKAWISADPGRRKTAGGMKRFIVGWLNRAQNNGQARSSSHSTPSVGELSMQEKL